MQKVTMIILAFTLLPVVAAAQKGEGEKIMKVMNKQVECWNKGDLECFMTTYWRSDSLKFIGGRGVTYGWQNTLDNYRKRYPDQKARGKLAFDIVSLNKMGEDHYFMVGKYYLTREIGDAKGLFSLIWKKIEGDWLIIADHSSADDSP